MPIGNYQLNLFVLNVLHKLGLKSRRPQMAMTTNPVMSFWRTIGNWQVIELEI